MLGTSHDDDSASTRLEDAEDVFYFALLIVMSFLMLVAFPLRLLQYVVLYYDFNIEVLYLLCIVL
jgi:hypothetical protein